MNIWTSPVTPIVILVVAIAAIVGVLISANHRVKNERRARQAEVRELQNEIVKASARGHRQGYDDALAEVRRQKSTAAKSLLGLRAKKDADGHPEPDVKSRANKTNQPPVKPRPRHAEPKLPGKTFRGNSSSGSTYGGNRHYDDDGSNMMMGGLLGATMFSNSSDPEPTKNDPTPDPSPSPSYDPPASSSDSGSSWSSDSGGGGSFDSGSFGGGDSGSF